MEHVERHRLMDLQLQEEKKIHEHLGAFSDSAVPERAMKDKCTCTHMQRALPGPAQNVPQCAYSSDTLLKTSLKFLSAKKKYLTHKKRICGVDRHRRRNTPDLLFVERTAQRLNHESGVLEGSGQGCGGKV